ncbi:GNAT family N-acetyltransferase [Anaerocolumna sp.]|uniref:GNAT family N-acetyltransferase n=1 Tax=Anaerocolumna sp. TaxID=2041569 RepID=UPI0028ACD771|nr:GNAT family N-acetyltransferase [Anaerocolumna sp.]
MNYPIRRLEMTEVDKALSLVWEVFLEFEAPEYPDEGIKTFESSIIHSEEFKYRIHSGDQIMFGAFHEKRLMGVLSVSIRNHISLLFVHKYYHRKGVATSLFENLVKELKNKDVNKITVNSSRYGIPFYYKMGFQGLDVEQIKNGIRYTPMEYTIKV